MRSKHQRDNNPFPLRINRSLPRFFPGITGCVPTLNQKPNKICEKKSRRKKKLIFIIIKFKFKVDSGEENERFLALQKSIPIHIPIHIPFFDIPIPFQIEFHGKQKVEKTKKPNRKLYNLPLETVQRNHSETRDYGPFSRTWNNFSPSIRSGLLRMFHLIYTLVFNPFFQLYFSFL